MFRLVPRGKGLRSNGRQQIQGRRRRALHPCIWWMTVLGFARRVGRTATWPPRRRWAGTHPTATRASSAATSLCGQWTRGR